jgi:hypothetical protein
MYPKDILANVPSVEKQTCFVLMPFVEKFRSVYDAIVNVVEGPDIGFARCRRADELFGGGHIMADVIQGIARAEVVIADVTDRNPNVFYELGIAHSFKEIQSVLMITQSLDDLPFDLRHMRHIVYDPVPAGLTGLRSRLVEAIRGVTPADLRCTIPEGGTHNFPVRLPGPDRYLYGVELGQVMIGRNFAKFQMVVRRYGVGSSAQVVSTDSYGLEVEGALDVPGLGWKLKLDEISRDRAHFCLCEPPQ